MQQPGERMSEELKPFPFCGERLYISGIEGWGENSCYAYCMMCGAQGPTHEFTPDAKKLWDTRVEPDEPPNELPDWLKNIISGNIELLKTIPDLDGQIHGNIQALEWVLSLRRDK